MTQQGGGEMGEYLLQYGSWAMVAFMALGVFVAITLWVGGTRSTLKTHEKSIDGIFESLKEIRNDIKILMSRTGELMAITGGKYAIESRSPVQLAEFGEKISSYVKAKEWCQGHADKLDLRLDPDPDMAEYEIFDECGKYVENLFDSDTEFERKVKLAAYQSGTDTEQVLKVYQVELRDHIMKSHKSESAG